jgi:hypothetical protein
LVPTEKWFKLYGWSLAGSIPLVRKPPRCITLVKHVPIYKGKPYLFVLMPYILTMQLHWGSQDITSSCNKRKFTVEL